MSPISRLEFMCRSAVLSGAAVLNLRVQSDEPSSITIDDYHSGGRWFANKCGRLRTREARRLQK